MGAERNIEARERLLGLRISFDIDGVIVESSAAAVALTNRLYGTNLKVDDLNSFWYLTELFKSMGFENAIERANAIWNSEEVLVNSGTMLGAEYLISYLTKNGAELFFVTSRPGNTREFTEQSFARNLPIVGKDQIIMQKEGAVIDHKFKARMVKKLAAAYHFEDSLEHATEVLETTDASIVFVKRPWNRSFTGGERIIMSPIPEKRFDGAPSLIYAYLAFEEHLAKMA
jgi:uncharacterized HAD superfamily protein